MSWTASPRTASASPATRADSARRFASSLPSREAGEGIERAGAEVASICSSEAGFVPRRRSSAAKSGSVGRSFPRSGRQNS